MPIFCINENFGKNVYRVQRVSASHNQMCPILARLQGDTIRHPGHQ